MTVSRGASGWLVEITGQSSAINQAKRGSDKQNAPIGPLNCWFTRIEDAAVPIRSPRR
jgi:hypothetical protein